MTRAEAEKYASDAIAKLNDCKTDADLSAWDEANSNSVTYINLPEDLVGEMETAFHLRIATLMGGASG